jgi:hypothetical protein
VTGDAAAGRPPVTVRTPGAGVLGWIIALPPLVKIALGVAILVGVGLAFKQSVSPGPPPPCLFSCGAPPVGPVQPVGATFTSPTWRFSFEYPSDWQRVPVSGAGVVGLNFNVSDGSFAGAALVAAGSGTDSLTGLINGEASQLSQVGLTNVQDQGAINGAEIGFQPGEGEFYSAQYTAPTGTVYPVSVGIMAVQRPGEWVFMVGVSRQDPTSNEPLFFGDFDEMLDRWRWTG